MQAFWCALVPYIPEWIAPNTLTLTGLIANIVSVFIVLCFSPDAQSNVPSWSLIFAAISVFVYQTLDALDGKQARKTNSSSPLGELFDHGCDAISTVVLQLGLSATIGLGEYPVIMFWQFFTLLTLFYVAHWQCYITGTLEFARVDVTEAQFGAIFAFLVSSVFGVQVWSIRLPLLHLPLKLFPFFLILATSTCHIAKFYSTILTGGVGKSGTTVANTSVLFPIFPFGIVILSSVMVAGRSPSALQSNYPVLFLTAFGFVGVKIIMKLVVTHMSRSEMTCLDSVLFGPFLLHLNQYFNCPIPEVFVLWCCCIWAIADTLRYSAAVSLQLADYLNIYIFRVDKPPSKPPAKPAPVPGAPRTRSQWKR